MQVQHRNNKAIIHIGRYIALTTKITEPFPYEQPIKFPDGTIRWKKSRRV